MIDLLTLDIVAKSDEGSEIELLHPVSKEPLEMFITVAGFDSKIATKFTRKLQNKRLAQMKKKKDLSFDLSQDDLDDGSLNLLAECTLGWRSSEGADFLLDGKPLAFSKENAKKLYQRFPWIKEQVDAWVGDRANFLD